MRARNFFIGSVRVVLAVALPVAWNATPSIAQESGKMLYLVSGKATAAGAPTSPQQAIELLEHLVIPSLDALAKHRAEGKILAGGILVGARAGVFVVEAASNEEVTDLVRNLPFWGILEWKVTPLESFANRARVEREQVEQLKSMMRR